MSYKKTKHIPGKFPEQRTQEDTINTIRILTKESKKSNGRSIVLSCDPTHPTYNSVPGYRWQEKGKEKTQTIKANTGRKRITIIGAINLVDRNIVPFVTESNADRYLIKIFLKEVRKTYEQAEKITLIVDNAAYQKSYEIQEYAKSLHITLLYLPPYAPNLSIIERVWKFFKKKVLKDNYHETFDKFFEAVCEFFEKWDEYKKDLKKLITLNFEIIGERN